MTAAFVVWLGDAAQVLPRAAMKAISVPVAAGPFMPHWAWPWLVFGALVLLLYYVFRR